MSNLACPGVTAWSVARMRAKHQIVDSASIFADPWALRVLDCDGREMIGEPEYARAPRLRAFIAARSRIADDALSAARARGVAQAVVLGAGLDTTGLRHTGAEHMRVFEVDKPDLQNWKRAHLHRIGITPPPSLIFVPVDFETNDLGTELAKAGLRDTEPAFFIWLGVVPYLTPDAISKTLRLAAQFPQGEIVFDYAQPPDNLPPELRAEFELRSRNVARLGEPWISHFDPPDLHSLVRESGLPNIDDLDPAALHARFGQRLAEMPAHQPTRGGHVVHARRL